MTEPTPQAPRDPRVLHAQMPPTLWTMVLTARELDSPRAKEALSKLCEIYWLPLYAFIRRQGADYHEAQDLAQAFFEHLFCRNWLEGVDPSKGRFRSFLLSSLCNFLNNEREKEKTSKRGGGRERFVPWDPELAERRIAIDPAVSCNPETEFDRLWACATAERTLANLKKEYFQCGKEKLFASLSPYLTRPLPAGFYAQMAIELGSTEGALRISMHRLLQRFGQLLRMEVAQTIPATLDVDDELRDVLKSLTADPKFGGK